MPSLGDGAFIFVLALLLFGPKKLPELARQLGKLMAEFRRASNEFRVQMEEELRVSEQAERQKKLAELEAATPVTPLLATPKAEQTPLPAPMEEVDLDAEAATEHHIEAAETVETEKLEPLAIATSGDLNLMPPATGLPVGRSSSSLGPVFESIPHTPEPEASVHG